MFMPPSNTLPTLLSEWSFFFFQMRVWFCFFCIWLLACMLSRSVVSSSLWPARLLCPWNSPAKNTGVSSHSYSRGAPWPRGLTRVCCIGGRLFTTVPTGKRVVAWAVHYSSRHTPLRGQQGADSSSRSAHQALCLDTQLCLPRSRGALLLFAQRHFRNLQ